MLRVSFDVFNHVVEKVRALGADAVFHRHVREVDVKVVELRLVVHEDTQLVARHAAQVRSSAHAHATTSLAQCQASALGFGAARAGAPLRGAASVLLLALTALAAVWPLLHAFLTEMNGGMMAGIPAFSIMDELAAVAPGLAGWRLEAALPTGLLDAIAGLGFVPMALGAVPDRRHKRGSDDASSSACAPSRSSRAPSTSTSRIAFRLSISDRKSSSV